MDTSAIRKKLGEWYIANQRDLPWRRTSDPYAIWISEIMLQQTRVAAVIPYFHRFLETFPDVHALAAASEEEVLTNWAGLGYYSRARNMHKAAKQIVAMGGFPRDYPAIRGLPGIGDYTAAAVSSIAFGEPYAVVDGNVKRVLARLTNNAAIDVPAEAQRLLDRRNPGMSNQALMELGAVICTPGMPRCTECPVHRHCAARVAGTAAELPPKRAKPATIQKFRTLLVIRRGGRILLAPSSRVAGFWELPEVDAFSPDRIRIEERLGSFRHSITNSQYICEVMTAWTKGAPKLHKWWDEPDLKKIPLSTAAKKALRCLQQGTAK